MSKPTAPISPYLLCEDVEREMTYLVEAFGFRETERVEGQDGRVSHAEAMIGSSVVMLGRPGGDYQNPKRSGVATACVHVYVDDVDAHYAAAQAAGATIREEPADQPYGDRRYSAEDPEGHQWFFASRLDAA